MIKANQRRNLASIALSVSLLTHALVWICLLLAPKQKEVAPEKLEISYVEAPAEKTRADHPLRVLKQVVEQKHQLNDVIDDKAKYLSAFNQQVIHETKSVNVGKFNNAVAGGASPAGQKEAKDFKKQAEQKPKQKGELPSLRDLVPKFAATPGMASPPAPTPGPAAANDDYLKNVKNGLQTMLSTREFLYYSYYQRIKEQIAQYWEPNVREKVKIIYRKGRSLASAQDRVTQLLIVLDRKGELLKIEVITQSGIHDLDSAAEEAFKSAAPFPNPPKGMVENDGTIKIRWDFVLEA